MITDDAYVSCSSPCGSIGGVVCRLQVHRVVLTNKRDDDDYLYFRSTTCAVFFLSLCIFHYSTNAMFSLHVFLYKKCCCRTV